MSEDEIIKRINYVIDKWYDENLEIDCRWIEGLLDLYNKQKQKTQEEHDNWKELLLEYTKKCERIKELEEIEVEHQKQNGELQKKDKRVRKRTKMENMVL